MQGKGNINSRLARVRLRPQAMLCLLFSLFSLSGCSLLEKVGILSGPEPTVAEIALALSEQPYQLTVKLTASSDVNPDTQGRPSPIQIRLFISDTQTEVGDKSFEEIFEFSGQQLDPKPSAKLTLRPNQSTEVTLPANKSQSRLVIAAAYRDPYQSIWISTANITPLDSVTVNANITAAEVIIEPAP